MKTFVKENWYKLMVGTSMMMASFGFMIYAISPAYSNSELEKSEMNKEVKLNSPVGATGANYSDGVVFVDGGYAYRFTGVDASSSQNTYYWRKMKLP